MSDNTIGKGDFMGKVSSQSEVLKQEFKTWSTLCLLHKNMSKSELAQIMGVPVSRVSEAINGTGQCKKYIKQIIVELGNEKDLKKYMELYK